MKLIQEELLLEEYDNINVIDPPRTINVDSIDICMTSLGYALIIIRMRYRKWN
jgi:hypothetical protein